MKSKYVIVLVYFTAVIIAYYFQWMTMLSILTLPWSTFLIIIYGLLSHAVENIEEGIAVCQVAAAIVNIFIFILWSRYRRAEIRPK